MARKPTNDADKARAVTFAKRLKAERERIPISQSELSLRTGVPLDTIRSIENGRILTPGVFIAADLVYALEGSLDAWLGNKPKARKP